MFLQLLLVTSVSLNCKTLTAPNCHLTPFSEHLYTTQCHLIQCNVVVKSVALESELCYLLTVWVWPEVLNVLLLSFLICEMGIQIMVSSP